MIGDPSFDELVAKAPKSDHNPANANWSGVDTALQAEHIEPSTVIAVSWCHFDDHNIEMYIHGPLLAIVHPNGVLATAGKRKMLGGGVKCTTISFSSCKSYGPIDHLGSKGNGKYCIEFGAAGGILLGRLIWNWKATRFRDSRAETIAIAEERDRILAVVKRLLG